MAAQPVDEGQHVGVAPHPVRKAPEAGQRAVGIRILALAAHIAVDAVSVRPVGFDRHRMEALVLDQAPGDAGAFLVELVGAVGGLAQQHETCTADQVEQGVVVALAAIQADGGGADGVDGIDGIDGGRVRHGHQCRKRLNARALDGGRGWSPPSMTAFRRARSSSMRAAGSAPSRLATPCPSTPAGGV